MQKIWDKLIAYSKTRYVPLVSAGFIGAVGIWQLTQVSLIAHLVGGVDCMLVGFNFGSFLYRGYFDHFFEEVKKIFEPEPLKKTEHGFVSPLQIVKRQYPPHDHER